MSSLATFVLASLLSGLDLGLLALLVQRLGGGQGGRAGVLLGLAFAFKLGLLVLGAYWISRQPWCDHNALLAGLIAPFVLFIAWQALKLQLRHGRRT